MLMANNRDILGQYPHAAPVKIVHVDDLWVLGISKMKTKARTKDSSFKNFKKFLTLQNVHDEEKSQEETGSESGGSSDI